MAQDGDGHLLLFGGWDNPRASLGAALNDTYLWDGQRWKQLTPPHSPTPRYGASLAWDPQTHSILLFGGTTVASTSMGLADTWEWNGVDWTERHPAHHPAGGIGGDAAMSYDPATGQIVLIDTSDEQATWTWTGGDWQSTADAATPFIGSGPAFAYDPQNRALLLTWDTGIGGPAPMYSWDGTRWQKLATDMPGSDVLVFATDVARGNVLYATFAGGMYLWSGASWNPVGKAGDEHLHRYSASMFVPVAHGVIEVGGFEPRAWLTQNTEYWDGLSWTTLPQ